MIEEKTINKDYLNKLDREVEMISLTFDVVFKGVFERNGDLLKRFLISTLDLKLDADNTKIEILNNELVKENKREYQKRVDILVVLNDLIFIDIEINRSNFEKVKLRNSLYCDKLYTMLLEMGDKTTKLSDIYLYQLNLNTMDKSITYGEDKIVSFSLITKNIFVHNKYMVLKYLEFYYNLYYTNLGNLKESEIWLASLLSKTFTEYNEILSHILDDSSRERLVKEVIRMSKLNFSLAGWEPDKINDLMREEARRVDFEEGIEQGIEKGLEQEKINTIKNMLKKNMSLQDISDVTGKNIEEIENIKANK